MKKSFKSCLAFLLLLALLLAGAVGAMFALDFCPPEGPWPRPPWCSEGEVLDLPEVSLEELANAISIGQAQDPTPQPYQLPTAYEEIFSSGEWIHEPHLPSGFLVGHTFMDVYTNDLYNKSLASSITAMENTGANWVVYDNYWSYSSFEPPAISPFPQTFGFRNATREEICRMVVESHERGMNFALMLELNFDIAKGEFTTWEENQDFWTASQQLLEGKAQDIDANLPYWESWFESYGAFVLDQAAIAQECGADLFVVGKQIDGAVKPELADHWRELISRVREIYSGPVSYAAFTNEHYSQAEDFPLDALDYIIIYLYNQISELESPTLPELVAAFEVFHDSQFEPLSRESGLPVIFLTPFQSRDFGARQEWFEPAAPAPDVGEDLLIQAKLYEALFQSLEDEDWVAGVITWGFWWRDDFNRLWEEGDASFNKSSSVRNKPAEWIIRKWAEGIK